MITPWSRIVITLLFCLLGVLASAYAESAWVLWTAHHAGLKTYWADVAYSDLVRRAETYVHAEPCGMLWLDETVR